MQFAVLQPPTLATPAPQDGGDGAAVTAAPSLVGPRSAKWNLARAPAHAVEALSAKIGANAAALAIAVPWLTDGVNTTVSRFCHVKKRYCNPHSIYAFNHTTKVSLFR